MRTFRIVLLILVVTYSSPVFALDAGCVRFCGTQTNNNWSSWERPVSTTSTRSRVSATESRAMRVAGKGYKAFYAGNEAEADKHYSEAYSIYKNNESIRKGYCIVKLNIAARSAEIQKDRAKARRYLSDISGACSKYSEFTTAASNLRSYMERDMLIANMKLRQKVGVQRVNNYLDEFIESMDKQFSKPPVNFKLAIPGTVFFEKGITNKSVVNIEEVQLKTKPAPKFKVRKVPIPKNVIKKSDKNPGPPNSTNIILEALAEGDGFLDESLLHMHRTVRTEGKTPENLVALSYIQGLYMGSQMSGYKFEQTKEQWMKMLQRKQHDPHTWAAEQALTTFSDEDKKWLKERQVLIADGLEFQSLMDSEDADGTQLEYIEIQRKFGRYNEDKTDKSNDALGWSAYYYLLGLEAYPNAMKAKKTKADE